MDEKTPDRDEVRLLARHLSVAVLGVAACHIGLGDDEQAMTATQAQMPLLCDAAWWVFHETAGKDPARFLSLPVGGREVSLAFLADLFRQAKLAGVLDAERDFTPDGWYEAHRATISPFPRCHRGSMSGDATVRTDGVCEVTKPEWPPNGRRAWHLPATRASGVSWGEVAKRISLAVLFNRVCLAKI